MNHYWDGNEHRYRLQVFVWDKHFESGHQEIDRQHRQLVDLVNQLAIAIPQEDPRLTVHDLCLRLLDYAARHFTYEESLFVHASLLDHELANHRLAHQDFTRKVTEQYRTNCQRDNEDKQPFLDLLEYLVVWLAEHILIDDHRLVESLNGIAPASPEQRDSYSRNAVRMLASTLRRLHDYVTTIYRARISLHKSRFRLLAENSFDAYLWLDTQGDIQWCNRAFLQLAGIDEAQLPDLDINRLLQPAGRETLPRLMQRLLDDPQEHADVPLRMTPPSGLPCELASKWQVIIEDGSHAAGICIIMEDVTNRNSKQRKLRLFRAVLDQAGDAMFIVTGKEARIVDTNLQATRLLGYSVSELKSMTVAQLNLGLDTPDKWAAHLQTLRRHKSLTFTDRQRRKDGTLLHVEISARVVAFDGDEFLIGICRDITARMQNQHKERLRNKVLSHVLSSHARQEEVLDDLTLQLQRWLRDMDVPQCQVFLFDAGQPALYPHPRHAEPADHRLREQLMLLLQQPATHSGRRVQTQLLGEMVCYLQPVMAHQSWQGTILLLHGRGFTLNRDHSNAIGTATQLFRIVTNKFATERALHQREEHEAFIARHDALTGLYNRLMLFEFIPHAQARAKRARTQLAMVFIDIDHFKAINDNFGHALGDRVLVAFAQLIRNTVRDSDLVCRLSGDEFLVVMENIQSRHDVTVIADKLINALQAPLLDTDPVGKLTLSASIGIALYPQDGELIDDVIHHADDAMYRAKRAGRGTWQIYQPE